MTILLEGCSLVFELATLETKYRGGVLGFIWDWDNGSWCTDEVLGRVAYYSENDALFCAMALEDVGLKVGERYAEDVAIFLHGGRPLRPSLWAEVKIVNDRFSTCDHTNGRSGNIKLPRYFSKELSLAHYAALDFESLKKLVVPVGRKGNVTLYKDLRSDKTFLGPGQLSKH